MQVVAQHGGEVVDEYDPHYVTHLLALHKKSEVFSQVSPSLSLGLVTGESACWGRALREGRGEDGGSEGRERREGRKGEDGGRGGRERRERREGEEGRERREGEEGRERREGRGEEGGRETILEVTRLEFIAQSTRVAITRNLNTRL